MRSMFKIPETLTRVWLQFWGKLLIKLLILTDIIRYKEGC